MNNNFNNYLNILHNQEAINLSSLKPRFDAHGVTLHAVVKETLGVEDFRPYFKGDVFLDPEVNTIFIQILTHVFFILSVLVFRPDEISTYFFFLEFFACFHAINFQWKIVNVL